MTGPDVVPDRRFFKAKDCDSQEDKPDEAHDVSSSCDGVEGDEAQLHCGDSGHGHCQQRPQGHSSSTASYKGCRHHAPMSIQSAVAATLNQPTHVFCLWG